MGEQGLEVNVHRKGMGQPEGSIHAMEYYSAMKRTEALTAAASWGKLKSGCPVRHTNTKGYSVQGSVDRNPPEQASPRRQAVDGRGGGQRELSRYRIPSGRERKLLE